MINKFSDCSICNPKKEESKKTWDLIDDGSPMDDSDLKD